MPSDGIWESIAARGTLAKLHIGRPRFEQSLSLRELGIEPRNKKEQSAFEQQVKAGVKLLLPPAYDKKFRSIESSARHTLSRSAAWTTDEDGKASVKLGEGFVYAFETALGPFVPVDAFPAWLDKVEGYKAEYMGLKDALLANYTKVKTEVLAEYTSIAMGTWARLRAMDPETVKTTREQFVTLYVKAIRASFPTPEEIEERTYFNWSLRNITMPDEDRRAIVENALMTEADKARQKKLLMMGEMVRESMRHDIQQFGSDLTQQLNTIVFGTVSRAEAAIANGEMVPSKTLVQLESLKNQVKALNVVDNKEVTKWTETIVEAIEAYRSTDAKEKKAASGDLLAAIKEVRSASAQRLARWGRVRVVRDDSEGTVTPGEARRARRTDTTTNYEPDGGARRQRVVA